MSSEPIDFIGVAQPFKVEEIHDPDPSLQPGLLVNRIHAIYGPPGSGRWQGAVHGECPVTHGNGLTHSRVNIARRFCSYKPFLRIYLAKSR